MEERRRLAGEKSRRLVKRIPCTEDLKKPVPNKMLLIFCLHPQRWRIKCN